MNYGRKIINYIFGKRSNSSSISYEREQKVQADSDRSDIRVFETGISAQRYGNNRQSSRATEEEECNRLISIAKENNLYIDKALSLQKNTTQSHKLQNDQGKTMIAKDSFVPLL